MSQEFYKFIRQIFQDVDGAYSSKRVVVFISMILIVIISMSNLYGAYQIAPFIFEGLFWIVVAGTGIAALTERGIKSFSSTKKVEATSSVDVNVTEEKADSVEK